MLAVMNGRKTCCGDGEPVVLVGNPPVGDPDSLPLLSANMCRRGDGGVCLLALNMPLLPTNYAAIPTAR